MENIIISNPSKLDEIKEKISKQGKDKFHVIVDFDRTLTKCFFKGEKSPTVIAQIREGNYLTPDYASKAHDLFDKYYPIEINPKISLKEKKEKMTEWWKAHFNLLVECGMNKKVINEITKKSKIKFRKGVLEFLSFLKKRNIPIVIMSAGPGDMIEEHLKQENIFYNNINIIGNRFEFDGDGKVIKIKEPIIHAFNKSETSVKELEIYDQLLKRKNVLLLGDTIGDAGMIEGFPYENLIKIGFLNINAEENLEEFKKNYDVLILNDDDFDYVNELVNEIVE